MDMLGMTARWVAAARAVESERPDRLFEDRFARSLAGEEGHRLFETMAASSGGAGSAFLAVRTKFFDDFALRAVAAAPARQVVVLAAGMDARAFRLPWPPGTTLFEVERPAVLEVKESILRELAAEPKCDRRVVPADLAEDWEPALLAAGFRIGEPAFFSIEGLLVYLRKEQSESLLQRVSALAASGSRLAADIPGESFLRSPWTQSTIARLRELGAPWQYGTDTPIELLASMGWSAVATEPGAPDAHFGRWPYPAAPPGIPDVPRNYLVCATRV